MKGVGYHEPQDAEAAAILARLSDIAGTEPSTEEPRRGSGAWKEGSGGGRNGGLSTRDGEGGSGPRRFSRRAGVGREAQVKRSNLKTSSQHKRAGA